MYFIIFEHLGQHINIYDWIICKASFLVMNKLHLNLIHYSEGYLYMH